MSYALNCEVRANRDCAGLREIAPAAERHDPSILRLLTRTICFLLLDALLIFPSLRPQLRVQQPPLTSAVMVPERLFTIDPLRAGQPLAVTVSGSRQAAGRLTTCLRKLLARTRTAVAEILGRTPVEDPLRDRVLASIAESQRVRAAREASRLGGGGRLSAPSLTRPPQFSQSAIDQIVASSRLAKGQTTRGASLLEKRLADSTIAGIKATQSNAEQIIREVLGRPLRVQEPGRFGQIDVIGESFGQMIGIRVNTQTGRIIGFRRPDF